MMRISSAQSGEISFYNSLGQLILRSKLNEGNTEFHVSQLSVQSGVVTYHCTFRDGRSQSGKLVVAY